MNPPDHAWLRITAPAIRHAPPGSTVEVTGVSPGLAHASSRVRGWRRISSQRHPGALSLMVMVIQAQW